MLNFCCVHFLLKDEQRSGRLSEADYDDTKELIESDRNVIVREIGEKLKKRANVDAHNI